MKIQLILSLALVLLVGGCVRLGPSSVRRDRFDYNRAISDSWKHQTLLNILKIRYADMPLFVEVSSVVAGYSLESSVSLSSTVIERSVNPDLFSVGATGRYTDRPTITYNPITGQEFNLSFLTPIPPKAVLFLLQSGWSAELIFPLTVDSINGLRSQVAAGTNQRPGSEKYYRLVGLFGEIQRSGAVGMQLVKEAEGDEVTLLLFSRQDVAPEILSAMREASELIGLEPGTPEIRVRYGLIPSGAGEMAVLTRSLLGIMVDLATQIEVPEKDVDEGRTVGSLPRSIQDDRARLLEVQYSDQRPEDAFVTVNYRDRWFWIDDRDFSLKRTFAFLMILFSLMETGGTQGAPVVTIPAG